MAALCASIGRLLARCSGTLEKLSALSARQGNDGPGFRLRSTHWATPSALRDPDDSGPLPQRIFGDR
jgi:hypothetical protein